MREHVNPTQYAEYIASPAWARRKRRALALSGHRCEYEVGHDHPSGISRRCTRTRYLCVHHLTYARLGAEADEDLEVLCWLHHMVEHLCWFRCRRCDSSVFESYAEAESWLEGDLKCRGVDLDRGPVAWGILPTKEALRACLPYPDSCPAHRNAEGTRP